MCKCICKCICGWVEIVIRGTRRKNTRAARTDCQHQYIALHSCVLAYIHKHTYKHTHTYSYQGGRPILFFFWGFLFCQLFLGCKSLSFQFQTVGVGENIQLCDCVCVTVCVCVWVSHINACVRASMCTLGLGLVLPQEQSAPPLRIGQWPYQSYVSQTYTRHISCICVHLFRGALRTPCWILMLPRLAVPKDLNLLRGFMFNGLS